ncbi:nSTAND3 domain-containing NTPase [Corynebacterium sp. A21]|uniref:nSTAND3 domain-containing NTPase n=1 Tax=Corynebacterium sp. A21 TaxID=3457318 RepID=UPI003FD5515F
MAYQYSELGSHEFEALATRVFCRMRDSERFQLFQVGPDRGIDGVVTLNTADGSGKRVMIQAKNHRKYNSSDVLPDLEKFRPDEFDEYVLAHAASLSENAVDRIQHRFQELYGDAPITVLGQQTIEQVLKERENKGILESFPKLFLNSLMDLDHIIHREIWEYSQNKINALESQSPQLVETQASREIAQRLVEEKVCVVAGPAGIGKTVSTFLAAQRIIEKEKTSGLVEYSQICFVQDIKDIYKVSPRLSGVIFIFDDFLGDITLNPQIPNGNFRQFVDAIDKILQSKLDRLVYISRDYILKDLQAAREDEKDGALFDRIHQLALADRQSRLEVFASLTSQRIRELRQISPEYVTDSFKTAMINNREYEQLLILEFFNPRALYTALGNEERLDGTSLNRLKEEVGNPLTAIKSATKSLTEDTFLVLRAVFVSESLTVESLRKLHFSRNIDYRELLRALDGIWVNIASDHYSWLGRSNRVKDPTVSLANPTVKEFLAERFLSTEAEINYSFDIGRRLGAYAGLAQAVQDTDRPLGEFDCFAIWVFLDRCLDEMENNELNLWATPGFRALILWLARSDQDSESTRRIKQQLRKQALDPHTLFRYEFDIEEFKIIFESIFDGDAWPVDEGVMLSRLILEILEKCGSPDELDEFRNWFETLNNAIVVQVDLMEFISGSEETFVDMIRDNWENFGDVQEISDYVSDFQRSLSLLGYSSDFIALDQLCDDFSEWQEQNMLDRAVSKDEGRTLVELLESRKIINQDEDGQLEREASLVRGMFE